MHDDEEIKTLVLEYASFDDVKKYFEDYVKDTGHYIKKIDSSNPLGDTMFFMETGDTYYYNDALKILFRD